MSSAPIALFVYNRLWHAQQTIEALVKNEGANSSDLIIFSDSAKDEKHIVDVQKVRQYVKGVKGFKSVKIIESEFNKGLANSVISGVTQVLHQYDSIIVLEDDMVVSPYFLSFMNQGLSLYEKDDEVISIHGYIYPVKGVLPKAFFLRGAHCWGWATWKRGWNLYEVDGNKLLMELNNRKLNFLFDYDGNYPFTKMLRDQINGLNNSWAIRWHASAFLNNKLTLYPGKSLLQNIGFDDSGTHSVTSDKVYNVEVDMGRMQLQKIKIEESVEARILLGKFFKNSKPTLSERIIRKFYKWIKWDF